MLNGTAARAAAGTVMKVGEIAGVVTTPPFPHRADDANDLEMTKSTLAFECYYCVAAFGRRRQLLRHIAGHYCDDPFDPAQVRLDVIGTGEADSAFPCMFCRVIARYHGAELTQHTYSQHLQEMRFHCKLCDWPCDYLSLHNVMAMTGQTSIWSHRCVRCRLRFKSAQDSARHHKENGKEHLIQCLKCNGRCCSVEEILQHDSTHSSAAVPKAQLDRAPCTSADVTSQTTTGVFCNLCSDYFQDRAALLQHMRTHASVAGDDANDGVNDDLNDDMEDVKDIVNDDVRSAAVGHVNDSAAASRVVNVIKADVSPPSVLLSDPTRRYVLQKQTGGISIYVSRSANDIQPMP